MGERRTSAQIPDVSNMEKLTFDQGIFYQYGKYAVKNVKPLLIGGLVLALILCLGLISAEIETDGEVLWVEKGTRVEDEKAKFDKMFGGHNRAVSHIPINRNPFFISRIRAFFVKLLLL
jgi:hypothetical protein